MTITAATMRALPAMRPGFILENVPSQEGGVWVIRCECGEMLTFSYRNRGTHRSTLLVDHGEGEARLEVGGEESVAWAIGLGDPLADFLERVHDYEGSDE